jgi:peptidoglycan hydrolase-like protein with peptidoglycan-binding domain
MTVEKNLHPIVAQLGLTPGTPEAVLAVAGVFVKMKYEDEKKTKDNIFGRYMGLNHTAWCAEFVSYCFQKSGAGDLIQNVQTPKGYVGCGAGIKGLKKKGFKQVPVAEAQPGDIIFFDWEHDHDPDHTGIVLKNDPKKKLVTCREGNTSRGDGSRSNGGQCAERPRNYSVVFAVFRPNWKVTSAGKAAIKAVAKPVAAKPVAPAPTPTPAPVAAPVVVAPVVEAPVVAAPVVAPATSVPAPTQELHKIPNPGYPGHYLQLKSTGVAVQYIQQQLKLHTSGTFDAGTDKAVKALQKKHGLLVDGIVGPKTWHVLG